MYPDAGFGADDLCHQACDLGNGELDRITEVDRPGLG